MLSRARRRDLLDHDSVEKILRDEVSRVLRKIDSSPEVEEDIERLGYSLVDRILLGPISAAMACVQTRVSHEGRGVDRAVWTSEIPSSEMKHNR